MAKHIKNLLGSFLQRDDNWQGFLIANWNNIVGNLKDHVSLEYIKGDTIILGVNNSSWMNELYMLSDMLKDKINAKLEKPYIQKIRFKFRDKREIKNFSYANVKKNILVVQKIKLNFRQEKALERLSLKDKELSLSLENYFYRCCANGKAQ